MKRVRPAPMGRAFPASRSRTAHLTVRVSERPLKIAAAPVVKGARPAKVDSAAEASAAKASSRKSAAPAKKASAKSKKLKVRSRK